MVQDFMTNLYHQGKKKHIDDDKSGVFPNKRLERYTIQKMNLLIQIDIML